MSHEASAGTERLWPNETLRDSLRAGGAAVLKLYQARFELLLLDLEEEKERLEQRLILSSLSGVLFTMASLLVTAFVISVLWPTMGAWAIALFAAIYLGAGGAVLGLLHRANKERHRTFACTLEEFEKDARCFSEMLSKERPSFNRVRKPRFHEGRIEGD